MPIWTRKEIDLVWKKIYKGEGKVSKKLKDQLFEKWGGRPRYVLVSLIGLLFLHMAIILICFQEKAGNTDAQASLEEALGRSDLLTVIFTLGSQGREEDKVSDR